MPKTNVYLPDDLATTVREAHLSLAPPPAPRGLEGFPTAWGNPAREARRRR